MHLKGLKLNGFKSFADPTHLVFEPGVTAVVGPNGCGKSNIADAIRWVLGEQSAKALRGGKMQDVIFEGTDVRKPVGLCEVSLLLTNCEEQLGQEFHEIEITRRVSRDGASDYFLNGKACRLKDIHRLFMDTGVGRTSYSIMAQGQIDQILSSKPEDRRAVFEEAAGITRYKSQRREAMNKLALVEANLARITDIVAEVTRQIGSLKRQASKAVRYRKLSHRLRHLDLAQSARQSGILGREIADLEGRERELAERFSTLQEELSQKEEALSGRKTERQELIEQVQEAQQSVFDLRSQVEQARNQAHLCEVRQGSLQERIAQAGEEAAGFAAQLEEIEREVDSSARSKQLQLDVLGTSDETFRTRSGEVAAVEKKLAEAEEELKRTRYRILEEESTQVRLRNDCANLEVEARTARNRLERLGEERADQEEAVRVADEARVTAASHLAEVTTSHDQAQNALKELQEKAGRLNAEFRTLQQRIQELDRGLAQKTGHLRLLQQLQEQFEGFGEGAKALLQGKLKGSWEERRFRPLFEGLVIEKGAETALEALLGAAVEAVEVGDAALALEITGLLRERKTGRACLHFTPPRSDTSNASNDLPEGLVAASGLVRHPENPDHPVAALMAGCYVADRAEDFLEFWKGRPAFSFRLVAARDGALIDARGLIQGGKNRSSGKGAGILGRENEIRETTAAIAADKKQLDALREESAALNRRLEETVQAEEQARAALLEASRQVSTAQAEERGAVRTHEEAARRLERLAAEDRQLRETVAGAEERLQRSRDNLSAAEGSLGTARENLARLEQEAEGLRQERDARREALAQARFDLAEKKQRLELLSRGLSQMEERRTELVRQREQRLSEVDTWSEQIAEFASRREEELARAASLEQSLTAAQESVQTIRKSLAAREQTIQVLEREQSFVRTESENLRSVHGGIQVKLAEKRGRREFLGEEVQREYGVALDGLDWPYELWRASRPPEGRHPLDLDDEGESDDGDSTPAEPTPRDAEAGAEKPTPEDLAALEQTDWAAVANEVEALRQRLQSLGPVNLVAIEEYSELRERHQFLTTQCNDLTQSRDQLLAAIDEINRTSQQQFSETFEQIRRNFAQTFETLFGGGHADLRLLETEDVLESGIEIVAQPPGTRLKSVSLLSGGQRTMTAVGLLFAIYLVKPSPFCLLDELDAPLDESNIGRFTKLLSQFTDRSQFIIITHNKRTIAAAQAIYGVTMEEKGVSKVVSLKFHHEHHAPEEPRLAEAAPAVS
ncbi:MAG: chromosome segregation protein SMC [Puniceicoccaceae bacterium]|nr:MAG: chromosome segregation protein SMC [Puniceicoccaceae bacterium]